jgi:hypothetical protein
VILLVSGASATLRVNGAVGDLIVPHAGNAPEE